MTIRISISLLASLLFVTVLAAFTSGANAHTSGPAEEEDFSSSRILATGPLNIVYFEISGL